MGKSMSLRVFLGKQESFSSNSKPTHVDDIIIRRWWKYAKAGRFSILLPTKSSIVFQSSFSVILRNVSI